MGCRPWVPTLGTLEHDRTATRLAPDSATAQLALGEAAQALGEFDEALSAYQAAARRSPSSRTWLRLGGMADRMGRVDVAMQSLEQAYGPWRKHASRRVLDAPYGRDARRGPTPFSAR
jgi:tetratricopeptide (TPR) repeat protein